MKSRVHTEAEPKAYASIQVIDRAAALLDKVAADAPVSLKLIAADTGLHTSTAFRILAALEKHGYVSRDALGRYQIGAKLLQLSSGVRERLDLRAEARPVLAWLREQLNETVNLTVPEGDEVVYVERVVGPHMMRVEHIIGSRAPLHVTAVGKFFLADAEACRRYAARHGLAALTPNTITDVRQLERAIESARAHGYAYDNQEAELGVGCIGVPVYDHSGAVVAAISVSAPIERRRDEWIPFLQEAARRLSVRLGGVAAPAASRPGGRHPPAV